MAILGIETATAVCGTAIVHDGMVLAEDEIEAQYVHAEQLLPRIDMVVQRAGTSVCKLAAVAVSIGPGSFTGLRIGLSVAKGLTAVCGHPLIAVPTLSALAAHALEWGLCEGNIPVLTALDARRDEVYCQLFEQGEGKIIALWEPRDLSVGKLVQDLGNRPVLVTGDGRHKVLDAALREDKEAASRMLLVPPEYARCNAGAVARLGEQMFARGDVADAASLEPLYIKEFFFGNRQ